MSYLGLDVGTGLTKVARTRLGTWLGPGGVPDVVTVPSAVTYYSRGGFVIPVGYSADPLPGATRCDGFPALLGTARSHEQITAWRSRSAAGVTRDFLRRLLDEMTATAGDGILPDSGDDASATPGLVLAVPPRAPAPPGGDARDAGAEIGDALEMLGWPPSRLVAAPVAALLWLRHRLPRLSAADRVIVIDVGAGTADFSLCTVRRGAIRIVDCARVADWPQEGQDDASSPPGSEFTGPSTLAEHLAVALAEGPHEREDRVRLWRAFESALADDGSRDRLDAVLEHAARVRERHGNTVAIRFAGVEVTAGRLIDATKPLAQRLTAALGGLLSRQEDPRWRHFRPPSGASRVVLLGGLTALHPLRAALLTELGLDPDRDCEAVLRPADADRGAAVARGAALLAAGLADPGDRYPYGLRLAVHRQVRDALVADYFALAAPGSVDLETDHTEFLMYPDDAERPVVVTVDETADALLPVDIVGRDGHAVAAPFPPGAPPDPGPYWIGVRGGPSGPAIVLCPVNGGQALDYPLADPAGDDPGLQDSSAEATA